MNFPTYEESAKNKQLKKKITFIVVCIIGVSISVALSILPSLIG